VQSKSDHRAQTALRETMTATALATQIIDRMTACKAVDSRDRLRADGRWAARVIAESVLGPYIPAGTNQWLLTPAPRRSGSAYARDAVAVALSRCAWAGGPVGAEYVVDAATRLAVVCWFRR